MARAFNKGDIVFHMGFGVGEILSVEESAEYDYPLTVFFSAVEGNDDDKTFEFTREGKYLVTEINPTLFHIETAKKMGLVKNIPTKFFHIVEKNDSAEGYVLSRPYRTEREALEATASDEEIVSVTVRI